METENWKIEIRSWNSKIEIRKLDPSTSKPEIKLELETRKK